MMKVVPLLVALTVGDVPQVDLVGKSLAPRKQPAYVGFVIDRNGCIWQSTGEWLIRIRCIGKEKMKLFKE